VYAVRRSPKRRYAAHTCIEFNMTVEVTNSETVSADWPVIAVGRSAL